MKLNSICIKFFIALFLVGAFGRDAFAADFTVLVNPSVGESAISKDELKQVLLTNKTNWKDGKKIVLITLSFGSDEADTVTKEFMGMSSVQAKKHWLTKVFGGSIPAVPQTADSADEAAELVAKTPGAIVVVPGKVSPGKAKALNLN